MLWNKGDDNISFDNKECSCFGGIKIVEQRFLAKSKTFQNQEPLNSNQNKNKRNQQLFLQQTGKKSLKRKLAPQFQVNKFNLLPNVDCAPQEPFKRESSNIKRQFKGFLSPPNKPFLHRENAINEGISRQFLSIYTLIPSSQQKIISCKNIPKYYFKQTNLHFQEPDSFFRKNVFQGSPIHMENIDSCAINKTPVRRVETNYHNPKRTFSPISGKNRRVNEEIANIYNSQKRQKYLYHTEEKDISEKDKSESTRIISKVPQSQPQIMRNQALSSRLKINIMKSNMQMNKKKSEEKISSLQTFKSGIRKPKTINDAKKQSSNELNRSILKVKVNKQHRNPLKKMDDVIQIYSQPDENQALDSDKQSIVLGRLNEYGSMIDPAISQISAVTRPVQGKMIRMNSLAVNFDQFMMKK